MTAATALSPRLELGIARDARAACLATLEAHSKSFALAGRLLPPRAREDAAALYAWCRYVDDAVDLAPEDEQWESLQRLEGELSAVYAGSSLASSTLAAFQAVVLERRVPEQYARELLAGMRMDVEGARYESLDDLLIYCHRVAGVVGLMMCHVMGVREPSALRHAAHLGMAMQLTNICRDVLEDWGRGRLYLPEQMLAAAGAPGLWRHVGGDFPGQARAAVARVVRELLSVADRLYASGDLGLTSLDLRSAYAVRTARLVYSEIGVRVAKNGYDVLAGRAVVPRWRKLVLAVKALVDVALQLPRRGKQEHGLDRIEALVRYPDDVLPF